MNAPKTIDEPSRVPTDGPELVGVGPGLLMFSVPRPPGSPFLDTLRSRQIGLLSESQALSQIPPDELGPTTQSLSVTLQRAEYHYRRFRFYVNALDKFREEAPGDVFYDALVGPLHFELEGLCGAARTSLDEIVYLAARRSGAPPEKARHHPWDTNKLIKEPLPARCNVPEIRHLRTRIEWFDTINAYRNAAYHHGWTFGHGHYDYDDKRAAAKAPQMNAMLLPDAKSLLKRKKPFEWTYANGTRADAVAEMAYHELDKLLREVCEEDWGTPEPAPGKHPPGPVPPVLSTTAIVTLHGPAILSVDNTDTRMIAFFSSREAAAACDAFAQHLANLELVQVRVSSLVIGRPAVSFTMRGLRREDLPVNCTHIEVVIDPIPNNPDWTDIGAAAHMRLVVDEILKGNDGSPISIPVTDKSTTLFTWRRPAIIPRA